MNEDEHKALAELTLDFTLAEEHVWNASQAHVADLHAKAQRMISRSLREASRSKAASPTGLVLTGRNGAGKTHMLSRVRQRMRTEGGYFFLTNLGGSGDFWSKVADALLDGFTQDGEAGRNQLGTFLNRLAGAAGVLPSLTQSIVGDAPLTPGALDDFVVALRQVNGQVAMECQDTVRALVLYASQDPKENNLGHDFLSATAELWPEDRRRWNFRARPHEPRQVVAEVSKLLALTGPSVIGVDQIDTLVALSNKDNPDSVDSQIEMIADGLMMLRDETRRTLTIVACLPASWNVLKAKVVSPVLDRFTPTPELSRITDPRVGRELVVTHLAATYGRIGFVPPQPTWPVAPSAFEDVQSYTPRQVLRRIAEHVESCLSAGQVRELTSFAKETAVVSGPPAVSDVDFAPFDRRFAELKQSANTPAALHPENEDRVMPGLLAAGLNAWVLERGPGQGWSVDSMTGVKLHARLRLTLDEELDDQAHWSFRAVATENATAAQRRLNNACEESGIRLSPRARTLVLIRNTEWSRGRRTQENLAEVAKTGGVSVPVTEDDLRTFAALRKMFDEHEPGMQEWLAARRPASGTELFSAVLPGDAIAQASDSPVVPVGRLLADRSQVTVPLESLRKHVVIFAGSGSGKTVLVRRLVEECALLGVSSIVLDLNNDLARLGDPWPEPPDGWDAGDEEKARTYLRDTDVVVWTPGRPGGRPLRFEPLPDFTGVLDDPDEFEFAVRIAVAALAPRLRVDGTTDKARWGRAVLSQAIEHYGRTGGRDLDGLIDVLADLPENVSDLVNAPSIAAPLAQTLRAEMVNDPLLRMAAGAVDPGVLLTPAAGKRARVSVVNLDGLESLDQKQIFVNQLQMELFAWVKRNPAGDRPLGGLLVMDEAQDLAPATGRTPSTGSSVRLASQARKFGLGLVLATQAPRAIHNTISGNATTQFFGRLNHPTHIEAAQDLARRKGRNLSDLGLLSMGDFYLTGEGIAFQKVHSPLCLTHHPRSPLTADEVVERAKRTAY